MAMPDDKLQRSGQHLPRHLVTGRCRRLMGSAWLLALVLMATNVPGAEIELMKSRPDNPYAVPRPTFDQQAVPIGTTFYIELAVKGGADDDVVLGESVEVWLQPVGHPASSVLEKDVQFVPGYHGFIRPGRDRRTGQKLIVYIDSNRKLLPASTYTIQVTARSRDGAELPADVRTWRFTTAARPATHPVDFALDLNAPAVSWHGGFFTGFCGVTFGGNDANRTSTFELMDEVRRTAPRAWSLQRDFWLTGMEHQPQLLTILPNIVRERETRRISTVDQKATETVLTVEDFFGHQQYGIPSGRPLSGDYHRGDEVLIADGVHDARAKVLSVDDDARTVTVTSFDTPTGGWKLAYSGPLPQAENPNAPGLFPPGGTYLLKFSPCGRPAYYWGRLDHEWDLAHRRFGRRLIVNFTDAPGDLSIDGRNWTTAKDYAELHEVVRAISGHVIDRYGEATLSFPWSVFNEPNLGPLFWRSDWKELQKFYDYTTDAILRAFEDRGYDSQKVFIGGLELAGAFASENRLRQFLAHCSPGAEVPGALPLNAAYADRRLDGKRSARVEKLCRRHDGRGAPCDFISIHAYKSSREMAARLFWAKETALDIDPEFYSELWINSREACPGWQPLPDPAFSDSYLGNGYYVSWCADVARRQLQRGALDARFAFGESILTYWPGPPQNFGGLNDFVRQIHVNDDGDSRKDRSVTVAMPILHLLGLMAQLGDDYHVLPERTIEGHVVSGFASRAGDTVRVLLYSHNGQDTQSRSDAELEITVRLSNFDSRSVLVREYRFDRDHNSYFRLGRSLRDAPDSSHAAPEAETLEQIQSAIAMLQTDSVEKQLAGLKRLAQLGPRAKSALGAIYQCIKGAEDDRIRAQAISAVQRINLPKAYPAYVVREIEQLSHLRQTGSARYTAAEPGKLELKARIGGNGVNYLVVEPASAE